MFEYDKYAKAAAEELDKYDFTDILSSCYDEGLRDFYNILDKIIEEHKELDIDDGALDNLSSDEIMDYLSARYNVTFDEITTYRMRYVIK